MRTGIRQRTIIGIGLLFLFSSGARTDTISGIKGYSQEKDEWCWAGISESIIRYYDKTNTQTQTQIASVLTTGNIAPHTDSLPKVLIVGGKKVGLQVEYVKSSIPWADAKKEADSLQPFWVLISWTANPTPSSTNYHSNLFCGYLNDSNHIKMLDPGGSAGSPASFRIKLWKDISWGSLWWRTYKTRVDISTIVSGTSFTQVNNGLRVVRNPMQTSGGSVTFLFNGNSNASKILGVYNARGSCVYESVIRGNATQASWDYSNRLSSGMYYASLQNTTDNGLQNGKASFYLMR
jgi:hypothetical protein